MGDYLCNRCQDTGGSCCCRWCFETQRWAFIRCDHMECWVKNGRTGLPPTKGPYLKLIEWP